MVERYLYAHGVSPSQFAPRLALMCLWTLVREVPVSGGGDQERGYLLAMLNENVAMLS